MKNKTKKKNRTPDRKISHTFEGGFTIYLGPSAMQKLDETNKSLRKIKNLDSNSNP